MLRALSAGAQVPCNMLSTEWKIAYENSVQIVAGELGWVGHRYCRAGMSISREHREVATCGGRVIF